MKKQDYEVYLDELKKHGNNVNVMQHHINNSTEYAKEQDLTTRLIFKAIIELDERIKKLEKK